ncbi:MAG: DUF2490 domain-containing protein [Candidatus Omnitrophota bacterium]
MFKKLIFVLIVVVALGLFVKTGFAFDNRDFQYWNTESIDGEINKDVKISFEEEFRFGDDAAYLYYRHSDLGISYSGLNDWLIFGINYRYVMEKKNGVWEQENRPHLNATVKGKAFDSDLSNRARLEIRDKVGGANSYRYRNKFSIKSPWQMTNFAINPYIEDEIFYDFDDHALNRNRIYAGISSKIMDNLKAKIFYLLESTKSSNKWIDANVLGTQLQLSF